MTLDQFLHRLAERRILFEYEVLGQYGIPMTIYKFRTMTEGADRHIGRMLDEYKDRFGKPRDDWRVTTWGRLLRFTHIDELPQIISVKRGEMKLIGTRPKPKVFWDRYPEEHTHICIKNQAWNSPSSLRQEFTNI